MREVFAGPSRGPGGLTPYEAAEILLVARWFRLNPEERARALPPEGWEAALVRAPGPALMAG